MPLKGERERDKRCGAKAMAPKGGGQLVRRRPPEWKDTQTAARRKDVGGVDAAIDDYMIGWGIEDRQKRPGVRLPRLGTRCPNPQEHALNQ